MYTRKASRNGVYENGRSEQPPNELIAEYSFRYSFNFAICRLKSTIVMGKHENELRSERRHYRRRRIYLEGIQIYTKRFHSVQPFPRTIHNPTTLARHEAPFTSVLPTVTDEPQCVRRIPHCGTLPARFAM